MQTQGCVVDSQNGQCEQFAVEQGPRWLADLFYSPPEWLAPALFGVGLLVLAVALYAYRRYGLSEETKLEMLFNATVVLGVGGGVWAMKSFVNLPYYGDVIVGLVVGMMIAYALQRWCYGPMLHEHKTNP